MSVFSLVLATMIFCACTDSKLLAVRDGGTIGFFDNSHKWTSIFAKNIKAKQVYLSGNGDDDAIDVWVLNARNGLYRVRMNDADAKPQNMRSTFVSFTAAHTHALFGVNEKGKLFQCVKPCMDAKQWTALQSPPITAVDRADDRNSVGSKIRDQLKMEPLYSGKLIQIVSNKHALFGRDEIGKLWKYSFEMNEWQHVELRSDAFEEFVVKWISVVGDENENEESGDEQILYVINDEDQRPYTISLNTQQQQQQQFELIHDANDFEQIVFDATSDTVWALNYYQQLFYLNAEENDWKYVTDEVQFISIATMTPTKPQARNEKTDL